MQDETTCLARPRFELVVASLLVIIWLAQAGGSGARGAAVPGPPTPSLVDGPSAIPPVCWYHGNRREPFLIEGCSATRGW
jgi:hypothetical protein